MEISEKYELPENNFIKFETVKKRIVLGNATSPKNNFINWTTRYNGTNTKSAAYTIDAAGVIYKHFDPIYCSTILNDIEMDRESIMILLENNGWLIKNKENQFINWIGNIYNKPELVIERKWRGQTYWAPYSDKQVNATIQLVSNICDEFNIDRFAIPHNTKIDDFNTFNGVIYRSNINKNYTDLSPAWSCENFKYKLENGKYD